MLVFFDTIHEHDDENAWDTPYVCINKDFECPGPPSIEWFDGHDGDGGQDVVSVELSRNRILIKLDRGLKIEVSFEVEDQQFNLLTSFMKRMLDDDILVTA